MYKIIICMLEIALLCLGVHMPLITLNKFWFFSDSYSVLSIVSTFWQESEYTLAVIILSFGVLFPIIKSLSRFTSLQFIKTYSLHKFAMVDIFLLSFVVFLAKSSSAVKADVQIGFYVLLAAVLLGYASYIYENYKTEPLNLQIK